MKVFKFGGASVKNAAAVRNVATVLNLFKNEKIVVIVSAMDKTTNALEEVVKKYFYNEGEAAAELEKVKVFHQKIMEELFSEKNHAIYTEVNNSFVEIEWLIEDEPTGNYDFTYDQIVSIGEFVSSKILSAFLNETGVKNKLLDVRDVIKTDNTYRDAKVDWEKSQDVIPNSLLHWRGAESEVFVTQGFIGVTSENYTTTLGREGSDYSAAILANLLNAESVTIWKDVPGFLNADPKWFDETVKLRNISYHEAIELSYYGATIIHPKTIQPLRSKNIPLYVKSFVSPNEEGTIINENISSDSLIPSFIFRMNQALISIFPKDYSFIAEDNLSEIFSLFAEWKVKINLMQNSAISFSVSVDFDDKKTPSLIDDLKKNYKVLYNSNLELVTIRHYDQATINRVTVNKEILLEQKTRQTARMVMRDLSNQ